MINTDFSKDTKPLLEYEIDDFDTKSYEETGEHPTGINHGRMRLPTRYDISKYYKRAKRNTLAVDEDGEEYIRRKGEYGTWKKKAEEDLPSISKDFDWQITYSFPSTKRDPETAVGCYGGANVTFRRLYLILCEHFNGGEYFIDDYFDTVYPYTVKPEVDARLDSVKAELISVAEESLEGAVATKKGTFDRRHKVNRGMKARLKDYESFAREWEDAEGEALANLIKEDIINCMLSGQLQLECVNHLNTVGTKMAREKAGLSADPVFMATGQLIESIQLYVKIRGNNQWQTKQGILV